MISVGCAAAAVVMMQTVTPQSRAVEDIRALASDGTDSALVARARGSPDEVRETLRQLLAGAARDSASDALNLAGRVAGAYAVAWQDSFLVRTVARFGRLGAQERLAKARGDSVRLAGNAALDRAGVDAAMRRWRESLRILRQIDDSAGVAMVLGNLGVAFLRREELDSAESYLTRSYDAATRLGDIRTANNAIASLAEVSRMRGELRVAGERFTASSRMRPLTGDSRGLAADHNNIGLVAQELGDIAGARSAFMSALSLNRAAGREERAATNLVNLGNLLSIEGSYAGALDHYGDALAIYRRLRFEPDIAFTMHSIGALALRRGDYRGAIASLAGAAAIYRRTGPPVAEIATRQDLVSARAAVGDLNGARAELHRAESLSAGEPAEQRDALNSMLALSRGDLEIHYNRLQEAEREYARAVDLARGPAHVGTRAAAQQGIGMVHLARESYVRAQSALEQALRTHEASGDRRAAALTRLLVAYAARHRGDTALARRALRRAIDTLGVLRDAAGHAAAFSAMGDLELQAGLRLTAESLYTAGLARLGDRRVPDVAWQLHAGLARARRAMGDAAGAADALRRAIAEIEHVSGTMPLEERRAAYLEDKWDTYVDLAILDVERGLVASAFETSERLRARQMLDLLARGRVSLPGAATGMVEQEQDLRRRISELTGRLETNADSHLRGRALAGDERGAALEALLQAQGAYSELLIRMRERHPAYASVVRGEPASLAEVRARLGADDLLLEYLVGDSTVLLFAVTRDTVVAIDLNIAHDALASLVDFARAALSAQRPADRNAWRAPMRRLHAHLVAPAEERGLLQGKRRLLVAPHAELHYLPFAALLPEGASGLPLIHRFVIEYIPSASVWLRLRQRPIVRRSGVLAFAPVTERLPASMAEVQAIQRLYGDRARVLVGQRATERALQTLAPDYDVIHLATFGVLNKHNPLFSYVEMRSGDGGDGRLEAHEVFALELNANLLVLSACQTGLAAGTLADVPPGDDWVGLVRTFMFAGAANVAATLWPVEDRSTAALMERFHRLLVTRRSPGEALAEAQREMARHARTSHPFHWAGFAMVVGR